MKMIKLIANKPHTYATRRLIAGEEYEVPARYAPALIATKKARFAPRVKQPVAAEPATEVQQSVAPAAIEQTEQAEQKTELDALRAEAEALGIDVDRRWGPTRLQYEIAQARK